jgi:DNA-binding NtrC family response regulator
MEKPQENSALARAAEASAPEPARAAPTTLDDIEKKAILEALERCGGKRGKAAEELGITRKTILNKLKSYGL